MNFDDFDAKMRTFETADDAHVPEGAWIVVRLDGRGFTGLTRTMNFAKPFDPLFCNMMERVTRGLMTAGFNVEYGYTQSDEISLLFDQADATFERKTRKILSTLAGVASGLMSLELGRLATLDARIAPLPSLEDVRDYFRWRQEDARRNAINAYAYWKLRQAGDSRSAASRKLLGMGHRAKLDLLGQMGVDTETIPGWQIRGIGLHWRAYEKPATNPKTGEQVIAKRRQITTVLDLPDGAAYGEWVTQIAQS